MTYRNDYKPPPPVKKEDRPHEFTPLKDYDFNFMLNGPPIELLRAEGTDVILEPLVPSIHAQALLEATLPHPEMVTYLGAIHWQDLADVLMFIESFMRANPGVMLYAIKDKKSSLRLAGLIGYMESSSRNLSTELGFVFILPHAQRTHVLTHSVSLLLNHAFALPSEGGHGLRRVQWQAHGSNLASLRAAERLGFVNETPDLIRAQRTCPPGKVAHHPGREGDALFDAGWWSRDSYLLGMTYLDWEGGGKERMRALVERKPKASS